MTVVVILIVSNLFFYPSHQLLTSYLSYQRYGSQTQRTITNRRFVLTLTNTFTSIKIVVNQWLFHHHNHQYLVLIPFLGVQLSTKNNSTRISILPRQSPTPLARLLFKLSTIIGILSVWNSTADTQLWVLHRYWGHQSSLLPTTNIWHSRRENHDETYIPVRKEQLDTWLR